jgi:hypothetical protein
MQFNQFLNKNLFRILFSFILMTIAFGVNSVFASPNVTVSYVYSNNCRYCHVFESKILSDPEVRSLLSKFNFKKVTSKSTKPRIMVTPTVIIYQNNKIVKQWVPSLDKGQFIDILRDYE